MEKGKDQTVCPPVCPKRRTMVSFAFGKGQFAIELTIVKTGKGSGGGPYCWEGRFGFAAEITLN